MSDDLDSLPMLSARTAYLAMLEFLRSEFELCGPDKTIHLGGLLAEMEPEANGTSADPGAVITFQDAVAKVTSPGYRSAWQMPGQET